MSTLYFERRHAEVHTVEDNEVWFQVLESRRKRAQIHLLRDDAYIRKIDSFPDAYFDLIVIDGSNRLKCFERASAT